MPLQVRLKSSGRVWGVGPSRRRAVADPVARPRTEAGRPVSRVREPAALQREAAATDALGEADLEALELGDAGVDALRPGAREARPVAACRRVVAGQLG